MKLKTNWKRFSVWSKKKKEKYSNKWSIKWWNSKLKWKKSLLIMKTLWKKYKMKWWTKSICSNLQVPWNNWNLSIFHKWNNFVNLIHNKSLIWKKSKNKVNNLLSINKNDKLKISFFNMRKTWLSLQKNYKMTLKNSMMNWWWNKVNIKSPKWPEKKKSNTFLKKLTRLKSFLNKNKIKFYNSSWKSKTIKSNNKKFSKSFNKKSIKENFN